MLYLLLDATVIILYLLAAGAQGFGLLGKLPMSRLVLLMIGFPAVIAHAYLLYHWIDIGIGQNLTFFNMLSLVLWLVSSLILLTALRKPVENLSIFVFPLAAISILFILTFPSRHVIDTAANPKQLAHILLSIFTFSVLCVAAVQAIVLAIQERHLRRKTPRSVWQALPSLETMETLLFQMIWLGFLLLTAMIAMSLSFFHAIIFHQLIHKTVLVIMAWLIFATLLAGRYLFGWRGRKAIYCTLFGVLLLIAGFFGSEYLREIVV